MNRSLVLAAAASLLFAGFVWLIQNGAYQRGYSTAQAEGDKALAELRGEHDKLRADAAEQNLVLYRQQVERANHAERVFLDAQDELESLQKTIGKFVNMTLELGRVPTEQDIAESEKGGCCGGGGCGCH